MVLSSGVDICTLVGFRGIVLSHPSIADEGIACSEITLKLDVEMLTAKSAALVVVTGIVHT